uniref:BPI2 domain-containing protein n=1 Tax=Steinernema glaseri TaxID=37863 RepID=A0A1I7ZZ14_9BILA
MVSTYSTPFPGASLQFESNATAAVAPIAVNSSGVFATLRTNGTLEVLFPDQTRYDLGDIGSETVVLLEDSFRIENNTLRGEAKLISTHFSVIYSSIGPFTKYLLNLVWRDGVFGVMNGIINPLLKKGIPLPAIEHVALQNSSISFADDEVILCSDFVLSL